MFRDETALFLNNIVKIVEFWSSSTDDFQPPVNGAFFPRPSYNYSDLLMKFLSSSFYSVTPTHSTIILTTSKVRSVRRRRGKWGVRASELGLGLGTHLFVKVPQPRDSEVPFSVFESSCQKALGLGDLSTHSIQPFKIAF